MKICAIFVAFIVLVSADFSNTNKRYQDARKKCQEDPATRADDETLKNAFKGEINKSIFGTHAVCIYKYMGILDENSNIDPVEMKRVFADIITDEEKLEEAVKKCSIQRRTPEETAVMIFKCTNKEMAPYVGPKH